MCPLLWRAGTSWDRSPSNFNDMTGKVRNLVAEVSQAKDQQKNAEIRALEAQINPHFLYNTLDSINWMAIEKEEYEISRMLRNLGVILRYSVNRAIRWPVYRRWPIGWKNM